MVKGFLFLIGFVFCFIGCSVEKDIQVQMELAECQGCSEAFRLGHPIGYQCRWYIEGKKIIIYSYSPFDIPEGLKIPVLLQR